MTEQQAAAIITTLMLVSTATLLILLPTYWRARNRRRLLDLIATALENDRPIPPEVLKVLPGARPTVSTRTRDRRWGMILFSLGVSLILIGVMSGLTLGRIEAENGIATFVMFAGFGAVPACLGAGFLALGFMQNGDDDA